MTYKLSALASYEEPVVTYSQPTLDNINMYSVAKYDESESANTGQNNPVVVEKGPE